MVLRAGFHGTVGQPSAQVIDGSVGISSFNNSHLKRDPGSAGNRKTFSFSGWVKKYNPTLPGSTDDQVIIEARTSSPAADGDIFGIRIEDDGRISVYDYSNFYVRSTAGRMRDTTGWYHVFFSVDTTVASNNVKLYVNGVLVGQGSHAQDTDTRFNSTDTHRIGARADGTDNYWLNAAVTNFYVIDGQALEPTDFGFTDPLTNTWRPKKYTGTYGTNGFYLPLDGNSPIGKDKSGNGNDWIPVKFGGSNAIEKATGALPILNTVNGGRFATAGVRTDATVAAGIGTCALALPLVGVATDVSNRIDSKSSQKIILVNGNPTANTTISNFYGGSYHFDGTGDYLNTTTIYPDLNFKQGDFTIEAWCYASSGANDVGVWQLSYSSGGLRPDDLQLSCHYENNKFNFGSFGGSRTNGKEYSTERWHHVAEVRKDGVISTYINGVLDQSWTDTSTYWEGDTYVCVGGYWNTGYLWNGYIQDFRIYNGVAKYTSDFIPASTNPDILPDTPSGVSGSSKLVKIIDGAVAFDGSVDYLTAPWSSDFAFGTDDFTIEMFVYWQGDTSTSTVLSWGVDIDNRFDIGCQTANQIRVFARTGGSTFVDMSVANGISINKWIHLAVVRNSSAQTMKLYIDGVERASTSSVTASMPTDNTAWNGIDIGRRRYGTGVVTYDYYEGFISNLRILKGTALYTTDFTPPSAPLTNVTNTKLLCCQSVGVVTAAAVGIISDFGNYTHAPTFNPFNTDINTVRGQETGYCTLNPLATQKSGDVTLSNGNLTATLGTTRTSVYADLPFVGKMYYEVTFKVAAYVFGMAPSVDFNSTNNATPQRFIGESSVSYGVVTSNTVYNNGASIGTISDTFAVNDCMGWAYDSDSGEFTIFKNGKDLGTFTASTSRTYYPAISLSGSGAVADVNFGQKPFKFPPPDGFQPINSANVRPSTVIARPNQYVGVTTYSGTALTQSIDNFNFKPDLAWIKVTDNARSNMLFDSVRGAEKYLITDTAGSQVADNTTLTSFNSNGFTVGTSADVNRDTSKIVAWCWKAGGGTGITTSFWKDDVDYGTAAAAGLTTGDITPTGASVGTKQGFSIIKYSGSLSATGSETVPHGLSNLSGGYMLITKSLNNSGADTGNWLIQHSGLTSSSYTLRFDTGAESDKSGNGTMSAPDTSVFYTNYTVGSNVTGNNYIAYLWHDVPGLQKFGSYEGNGVADGPYIELGFRPAIVLIKNIDTGGTNYDWVLYDNERAKYNPDDKFLCPNLGKAENVRGDDTTDNARYVDFLSNGFKVRNNSSPVNASETIIYAAWAEAPSFNLYGGQSNAR